MVFQNKQYLHFCNINRKAGQIKQITKELTNIPDHDKSTELYLAFTDMKHDYTMAFLEYHMDIMIYEFGNQNTIIVPSLKS